MDKPRYNLIDESWIPVTDRGNASLGEIFVSHVCRALGGTPRQKIAVLKLLLAIAQAAVTPPDTAAWAALGPDGLGKACLDYLERWRDAFWLYGERPFLQMPVERAKKRPYSAIMPEVATGNTTVLTQFQLEPPVPDCLRALLLVCEMSLCLGGKKTDSACILTPGHVKKTARPGPGICHMGLLHSFLTGRSVLETVWLNLLTADAVAGMKTLPQGVGTPPWEAMPAGEDCPVARALKGSLMGRLVPLARFCLLREDGLHYTEGIVHPDYSEGVLDPSAAGDFSGSKPKMLWTDPEKRPWRSLTALLAFLQARKRQAGFDCLCLRAGLSRLPESGVTRFGIWSGGLKVSGNAGEQYVSGLDDNVESEADLDRDVIENEDWFPRLQQEMMTLEGMAKALYGAIMSYCREQHVEENSFARMGTGLFWELAEPLFQQLLDACAAQEHLPELRRTYERLAFRAFDAMCPHVTARQIAAWGAARPHRFGTTPSRKAGHATATGGKS